MKVNATGNLSADLASVAANGSIVADAVTTNGDCGIITTGALTTAHDAWEAACTVTNANVKSTSTILVSVCAMTGVVGTNGTPAALVSAVTDGSFTLRYGNIDKTNALSGAFKISYRVYNA